MSNSSFFKVLLLVLLIATFTLTACGDDDDDDNDDASPADDDAAEDDDTGDDDVADDDETDDDVNDDDTEDDDTGDDDTADDDTSTDDDTTPGTYWEPSSVVPIDVYPEVRGLTVQRGIIHIHSVYSHDACDNMPFIGDHPNWNCLDQLREAICTTNQQYVMLTDHDDPFSYYEFPDVLLYLEEEGDELIYDGDDPIANVIHCEDGNDAILMAGNENDLMPLHLKRMPDGTPEQRKALLGGSDEATVQGMRDLGALVTVNHAEQWETEDLAALSIDGIELYNLHANLGTETMEIVMTVLKALPFLFPKEESGHCDLMLLSFFEENATDLEHFDKLLADRRQIGVLATDVHRNSIPFPLWDGDRGDSYRRLMRWFSNYILVDEMNVDTLEEALANGRFYGAFQVFGEPVGFDFHAEADKADYEMGDEVSLADDPTFYVTIPSFYNMDPTLDAPEFHAMVIKAGAEGGTIVAQSEGTDIEYTPTSTGAYRVEIHVVPNHLRPWLGGDPDRYIHDYPLIYSNPIYVND